MLATKQLGQDYLNDIKEIIDHLPLHKLGEIVDSILNAYENNKQIFIFGNGGSASNASHFMCDINKGVSSCMEKRFKVICLNDNLPTILAYANDTSYEDIFVEQMKNFIQPGDLAIGISGSGNSENVLAAIKYANENEVHTIGLTGFDGGYLARIADISIVIPSNDMQKIEDLHLMLCHIIMQICADRLKLNNIYLQ